MNQNIYDKIILNNNFFPILLNSILYLSFFKYEYKFEYPTNIGIHIHIYKKIMNINIDKIII